MGIYKDTTDLYFTEEGDFFLDRNGDFEDTKLHQYRGFLQRLLTRIMSDKGNWKHESTLGANISDFLGKPNTRAIGEQIKSRVFNEIVTQGFVQPSDVIINVFPVGEESVVISISITPPESTNRLILTLTYDMRDNKLVPRNI